VGSKKWKGDMKRQNMIGYGFLKKILFSQIVCLAILTATPFWVREDFERSAAQPRGPAIFPAESGVRSGDWQRWSYIHEMVQTARFVAGMQVMDTLDPEFGGIIEGEDQMTIIETDNTQQAIWVWCRYYEIFGDTVYFPNIRKAWTYVMNHPAYLEENTGSEYYRVWNCGLGLFCEPKYRAVFGDSTYGWYADSCAGYMLNHPLSFTVSDPYYRQLHPKTTGLAAGMLYQYGRIVNDPVFVDTALAYGNRVKDWLEANPDSNLNNEIWAMSGGTCVWGLCRSIFDADTAAGISWLSTYLPYMKYFQPGGTWNNSWNIWYANAYNSSGRITGNGLYLNYHHALTDSLLVQDYDDDGGVPPTRGWTQYQDHAWVTNYMFFMGFEGLLDSIRNFDAGINGLAGRGRRPYFLAGDSLHIRAVAANYGLSPISNVQVSLSGPLNADTVVSFSVGEEDTIWFPVPWVPIDSGNFLFTAASFHPGDERPANDTFQNNIYIRPLRNTQGDVYDTLSIRGIKARVYFQFALDTGQVWFDSCRTDSTTGAFTVGLIDSLYRAVVRTEIPYPDPVREPVRVTPDSISDLHFHLAPADLAIVNRDTLARYANYYKVPLDSLNYTYKLWIPAGQGIFPCGRAGEFRNPVIIWYTGRSKVANVTPAEQESLALFLDQGGRLLITGQNIGEELSGTPFYRDRLHARLVSDSIAVLKCFPDFLDSLGQACGKIFTTGTSGAANQYSRDVIASDSLSHEFLYYDTTLTNASGIWYHDPVYDSKVIYLGFGLEAVHKPAWTGYVSRKNLLDVFLRWFGMTGITERTEGKAEFITFEVFPNPARSHLNIRFMIQDIGCMNKDLFLRIYDITGRLVKFFIFTQSLSPNPSTLTWRCEDQAGRRVPAGIYFVRMTSEDGSVVKKVIIIK